MQAATRGLFEALIGDGRSLITLTGICLALSGAFAIFQSATGHFLPHDIAFLQMSATDLCGINECRIVHFMIHDRVSFGGALIAIAVLYLWFAEFPLRAGESWAWWTLAISGIVGFGSFLAYLGYGYLDTWHAAATLGLLPCFAGGLWRSHPGLNLSKSGSPADLPSRASSQSRRSVLSLNSVGRASLLLAAIGLMGAGLTIQCVGMTSVFVPTDLVFMGLSRAELDAINPRLISLIAHDRAGFGGATVTVGLLIFGSVHWGRPSRSLWQALLVAGIVGWTAAIGVHPAIGYTDAIHLAPAMLGASLVFFGLACTRSSMFHPPNSVPSHETENE
jgi:hypothetical protein